MNSTELNQTELKWTAELICSLVLRVVTVWTEHRSRHRIHGDLALCAASTVWLVPMSRASHVGAKLNRIENERRELNLADQNPAVLVPHPSRVEGSNPILRQGNPRIYHGTKRTSLICFDLLSSRGIYSGIFFLASGWTTCRKTTAPNHHSTSMDQRLLQHYI